MKNKSIVKYITAVTISLMMSISVSAANTTDWDLPDTIVGFSVASGTDTPVRAKQDASSNYVYNTSGFDLWVLSLTAGGINLTVNNKAIVPSGTQRRVRNYIYENGYRSCKLNITSAKNTVTGRLRGKWSPDCKGSYPAAN